jgi:hypothetical protein
LQLHWAAALAPHRIASLNATLLLLLLLLLMLHSLADLL